jgi:hypothetical protein
MSTPSGSAHPAVSRQDPKLRHEFVGMMFAVAIGEVGVQTAILVQAHDWLHFLPAYSHLLLATIVIGASWVGWTLSPSPGARQDVHGVLQLEFLVLLLDVLLVIVYFILVKSVDFTGEAEIQLHASAQPETFWILVIFCMYLVWDVLTKIVLYFSQGIREPWFRTYGVRMIPTIVCLFLAWLTKPVLEVADPPHVLAADFALLSLVLLFRALKDLVSTITKAHPKKWPIVWTVLCVLGLGLGTEWTRSWPMPERITTEIRTARPDAANRSKTPTKSTSDIEAIKPDHTN